MMESGNRVMTEADYNASLPDDVFPDSRGRLPIVNRNQLDDDGKAVYDRYMSPDSTSLAGIQGPGGLRLHTITDKSPTRIDGKVRELVRLVISREMDQEFEWTMHEPVALRQGLSPEIIDVIRYKRALNGVPDMEASIIQLGRDVFQEHRVSSETYARLSRHFGKKDLIEITQLMGGGMNSFILLFMFDVHLPYDRESLLPVD
jgi:4-carboxymuconolactone decarboxylase